MSKPGVMMAVGRLIKLGLGVLAGLLLVTASAWGATCTSAASASWNLASTWTGCATGNGAVSGTPGSADTVTIGAAHTVTVDAASAALSLSITAPSGTTNGVTINGTNTLTVTNAVTLPTVGTAGRTSSVIVGAGTLNAGSIAIPGGGATLISQMTVSTGIITTTGSITFSGTAAGAKFTSTGASTVNVAGNFSSGGTLTTTSTGTINFNGSGAQSIGAYTTYNNVTINKSAGTATLLGAASMTGALTVTAGTLSTSTFTLGVAGNLVVNGTLAGTGAITLSGAGATIGGTGSITNTATLTMTGAKSILATANLTIASPMTISGAITITNNGTITSTGTTINGTVTGSTWTNAANSTLNVSASTFMTTGTLTASANPNTVNYAGAAQSVKVPSGAPATYYHLTLGGSGTKTMLATAMTVSGNFTMSGTTSATAAQALTVAGNFTIAASNTFSGNSFSHSVAGNWINNGTFTAATSTVTFTGTASTLGGTAASTFNNLTLNKTAGNNVSLVCGTPSPTVNATLTLTSGDIVTSGTSPACASTCATQVPIIVAAAGTVAGGSATSYVQGALRKMFSAGGTLNFRATAGQNEFPVGDTTNYTPVEITAGTTSTAGSVTACVTPTDHPQVTTPVATTGIDATKSVNRYWSLTTATINTTAVPVDATFKFVAGDVDAGATTGNFIVENSNGTSWSPTSMPAGGAGATSTRAQSIDLTQTTNDIAIGEPLTTWGVTTLPGQFNAFDPPSPANSLVVGMIQTKKAGVAFSVRLIRLNTAKTAIDTAYAQTGVTVELLDSSDNSGTLNATTACRPIGAAAGQWHVITGTTQTVNLAAGVATATFAVAMLPNAYRDVRVHISYTGSPTPNRGEGCSTDRFAIRPQSLTLSALDATWVTAGTSRTLANTGASGGNVHKAATAATSLPFTLRATPVPATATNYDGSPTTVAGFPTCGTLCTTVGGLSYTAGSWTAAGSGVRENATANYSEVGTFNLQLEDGAYASVDVVDGSSAAVRTVPATASAVIGRFVPDHFVVASNNTPQLKTFNSTACTLRSFTYIGQPFGYVTAPQVLVTAQNADNTTTVNYANTLSLWKITAAAGTQDCTTNPDSCTLTSGSITQTYTYSTTPAATPNWDSTQVALATPAITANNDGTGTVTSASADKLAFKRSTLPQAAFSASIALAVSVKDTAEAGNCGVASCDILTGTSAAFNPIAFDAGNAFRYGRLRVLNAYGSERMALPMTWETQYWNGQAFVRNTSDGCTSLSSSNIAMSNYQSPPGAVPPLLSSSNLNTVTVGALSAGAGLLTLAPTAFATGSVDLMVNLGSTATPNNCLNVTGTSTSAAMPYLSGQWCGAANDRNPSARASFGVYKTPLIYRRENY